jgi:hypothetical protein
MRIREAHKNTDPYPDPEYWEKGWGKGKIKRERGEKREVRKKKNWSIKKQTENNN